MASFRSWLIASLLVVSIPIAADETEGAVFAHKGTIDVIDFETSRLVVSGYEFQVPLDTPVSIRGGTGAFSLLQQGMKTEVVYREFPDGRIALQIDQLPDNVEIQQF
jgi:hypothetical protein